METTPDNSGITRLLPQYFGVLPEHRGLGRSLWRAAMHWGQQHQAREYVTQPGSSTSAGTRRNARAAAASADGP